jgi:hypothetical protein
MHIGDLTIDIPGTWLDASLYSFVAPAEAAGPSLAVKQVQFRKNVVLQRRPVTPESTLEILVDRLVKQTERDLGGGIKIDVEDGPATPVSPTRKITYRLVDPVTNQPVAQVLYLALVDGWEWQIAFSAPAAGHKEAVLEFDKIVASIRGT